MRNLYKYRAFGLNIESCVAISQISPAEFSQPDVTIEQADLSRVPEEERRLTGPGSAFFMVDEGFVFQITNGCRICFDGPEDADRSVLPVYLMGSCMGAVLIQRGFLLLHGSCVTDGTHAVLITGQSGAGKSTTAAEFLKRGWRLVTDDVTCVYEQDGAFMVRSSYPSQKLWKDTLDRYDRPGKDVHSLYFQGDREKFGVAVADRFFDGTCRLSLIVRLLPANHECFLSPIEGMAKVDQLMRNTYRAYFVAEKDRPRLFQRCVDLSQKTPMALAVRENGRDCAPVLFEKITKFLEEHYHD